MSRPLTFPRHLMTFVDTCKLQDLTVYQKWKENSGGQMSPGSGHLLLWLQHWGEVHCGTVSGWSLLLRRGSESGCSGGSSLWLHRHNKLDTGWWRLVLKTPENSFSSLYLSLNSIWIRTKVKVWKKTNNLALTCGGVKHFRETHMWTESLHSLSVQILNGL